MDVEVLLIIVQLVSKHFEVGTQRDGLKRQRGLHEGARRHRGEVVEAALLADFHSRREVGGGP